MIHTDTGILDVVLAHVQGQQLQLVQTSNARPYCACVVGLPSPKVEEVLQMWHLELPEMKAAIVVVTLLTFSSVVCHRNNV